jgi:hypothetical protein
MISLLFYSRGCHSRNVIVTIRFRARTRDIGTYYYLPVPSFQFLVAKRHPDLLFDPDTDTDPDPDFVRFLCLSLSANVSGGL